MNGVACGKVPTRERQWPERHTVRPYASLHACPWCHICTGTVVILTSLLSLIWSLVYVYMCLFVHVKTMSETVRCAPNILPKTAKRYFRGRAKELHYRSLRFVAGKCFCCCTPVRGFGRSGQLMRLMKEKPLHWAGAPETETEYQIRGLGH